MFCYRHGIKRKDNVKFEALLDEKFPNMCPGHIQHKHYLVPLSILRKHRIHFHKTVQEPGEMILTLPAGYHQVINPGLCFAGAVNMATLDWINEGLKL